MHQPFYPSTRSFLHRCHVGILREFQRRKSISHSVFAFIYSGLITTFTGHTPYGNIILLSLWMDIHLRFKLGSTSTTFRIFQKSVAFIFKSLVNLNGKVVAPLSYLKTRSDWHDFFKVISSKHFLFVPKYLEGKLVHVRLGHYIDHQLMCGLATMLIIG